MSSSTPRVEGDNAVFAFPVIQATITGKCKMRFHYHMIGRHVGALNIYKRTEVRSSNINKTFMKINY